MRNRKYTDEQFKCAVKESISWSQVLKKIGLKAGGGSYAHIQNLAKKLDLDTSHFLGKGWNIGLKIRPMKEILIDDILVENSTYQTSKLKNRLLKANLIDPACHQCKRTWWISYSTPIPLEVHHKNGINNDHRLENLELLCPNCHALTDTYCGKNHKPL